jgi:hypothetical protein
MMCHYKVRVYAFSRAKPDLIYYGSLWVVFWRQFITQQVTIMPYMRHFLILRSKGQGLSTRSGKCKILTGVYCSRPLNSPAQLPLRYNSAHQNSPKDQISSRGPRGGLGEAIEPQTSVLLGVLLTLRICHKLLVIVLVHMRAWLTKACRCLHPLRN